MCFLCFNRLAVDVKICASVSNGPQELLQAAFKNLKSPTGRIELPLRRFRVWTAPTSSDATSILIFNESLPVEIHAISWLSELSDLFCWLQWHLVTSVTPRSKLITVHSSKIGRCQSRLAQNFKTQWPSDVTSILRLGLDILLAPIAARPRWDVYYLFVGWSLVVIAVVVFSRQLAAKCNNNIAVIHCPSYS